MHNERFPFFFRRTESEHDCIIRSKRIYCNFKGRYYGTYINQVVFFFIYAKVKSFYLAAGHLSAFFITCFRRGDNCVCCVCVCVLDFFRCRLVSRYISVDSRYWFNWHSTRTIWIFYGFCKSMCFWDECCLGFEESGCLFWYESVYYLILTSSECVFEKNSSDWWKYVVYAVISKFDFFFWRCFEFSLNGTENGREKRRLFSFFCIHIDDSAMC